jgi:hypothetical protein
VDFKPKLMKRDKEGHFKFIKGRFQHLDIILNMYAPSVDTSNFIKQTTRHKSTDTSQ